MKQKIIKVGNSLAITLPSEFVKKTGYKKGDEVIVDHDGRTDILMVKSPRSTYSASLTPEFKAWMETFIDRNKRLIKKLANTT